MRPPRKAESPTGRLALAVNESLRLSGVPADGAYVIESESGDGIRLVYHCESYGINLITIECGRYVARYSLGYGIKRWKRQETAVNHAAAHVVSMWRSDIARHERASVQSHRMTLIAVALEYEMPHWGSNWFYLRGCSFDLRLLVDGYNLQIESRPIGIHEQLYLGPSALDVEILDAVRLMRDIAADAGAAVIRARGMAASWAGRGNSADPDE